MREGVFCLRNPGISQRLSDLSCSLNTEAAHDFPRKGHGQGKEHSERSQSQIPGAGGRGDKGPSEAPPGPRNIPSRKALCCFLGSSHPVPNLEGHVTQRGSAVLGVSRQTIMKPISNCNVRSALRPLGVAALCLMSLEGSGTIQHGLRGASPETPSMEMPG